MGETYVTYRKFVVGCMTGTSIDGLDAALLMICEDMAGDLIVEQIGVCSRDMPASLKTYFMRTVMRMQP